MAARFRADTLARVRKEHPDWLAGAPAAVGDAYVRDAIAALEAVGIDQAGEVVAVLDACAAHDVRWPWPEIIRATLTPDGRAAADRRAAFVHEAALGTHRLTRGSLRWLLADDQEGRP